MVKIVIDVVDFGEISVSPSTDNPGLVRLEINDDVGGRRACSELSTGELNDLLTALEMMRERM